VSGNSSDWKQHGPESADDLQTTATAPVPDANENENVSSIEVAWSGVGFPEYEPVEYFGVGVGQGNNDVGEHQKGDTPLPAPGGKQRS
jgi:hypothetical protein